MSDNKYDNSGRIFTNDRKENDRHPDYKGNITVDGKEYWLSGWKKQGQRGPFISLAIKPKDGNGGGGSAPARPAQKSSDPFGDDAF